jgi:hypothetical protein
MIARIQCTILGSMFCGLMVRQNTMVVVLCDKKNDQLMVGKNREKGERD